MNALVESGSTLLSSRGVWEHLEVLGSTGEVARSVWEDCVLLLDLFTFCWCTEAKCKSVRKPHGEFHKHKAFLISCSSLLPSQDSLPHYMACNIEVSLYIYIRSIWPQMVDEHNRRSTWRRPLRAPRDVPLGGHCGDKMELESSGPTINNPPLLSWPPNQICKKELF